MGQVFHLLNMNVRRTSRDTQRSWFEPGVPQTVLPGVTLVLLVDCVDGRYENRIECVRPHPRLPASRPDLIRFWALPRAVIYSPMGRPQRMLLEVSHERTAVEVRA